MMSREPTPHRSVRYGYHHRRHGRQNGSMAPVAPMGRSVSVEPDIVEERVARRIAGCEPIAEEDIRLALEQVAPAGLCDLVTRYWDSETTLDSSTVVLLVQADVAFLGLKALQQTLRAWQEFSMNRDEEARSSLRAVGAALDRWPSRGNPSLFDGEAASSYEPTLAAIQEFQRVIGRFKEQTNRSGLRLAEEVTELAQMAAECRNEAVLCLKAERNNNLTEMKSHESARMELLRTLFDRVDQLGLTKETLGEVSDLTGEVARQLSENERIVRQSLDFECFYSRFELMRPAWFSGRPSELAREHLAATLGSTAETFRHAVQLSRKLQK